MSIDQIMQNIASALPEKTSRDRTTLREVCLTLCADGSWQALAGGHPAVHIGESGGDFDGEGDTAEEALAVCLKNIRNRS